MGETGRALTCPECCKPYLRDAKFCAACGTLINSLELDLLDPDGEWLPTGTLIGSYRLVELLGEGGMGRVYVAEHIKLGRRVAIKRLRRELISNPIAVARFFAEARAVNRISHENIVEITDLIEQPGGDNCIVMELLKGEDLAHRLRRLKTLPLPRALGIAAQTASALAAVHDAGMIHRDLKPDNIFLLDRGGSPDFVKVLDFGVAKLSDVHPGGGVAMHTTAVGQIVGTPEYMSPEQGRGERVDFRTDLYALGVILYEMVTGRLPFEGTSFGELLMMHISSQVVPPAPTPGLAPEIQRARDELILALLAKQRADRPASMAEVATRLRALLDGMELPRPARLRTAEPRASTGSEAVGKLALVKRPTPQAAVELVVQRPGTRIEVRRPSSPGGTLDVPLLPPAAERAAQSPVVVDPPGADTPRAAASAGARATPSRDLPETQASDAVDRGSSVEQAAPSDLRATLDVEPAVPVALPEAASRSTRVRRRARPWRTLARAGAIGIALAAAVVVVVVVRRAAGPAEVAPRSSYAEVKLRFVSAPPGATVRQRGVREPLGVTPFTWRARRGEDAMTFELSKPGFAPVTEVVIPVADDAIAVVLVPLSAAPATAGGAPAAPPPPPADLAPESVPIVTPPRPPGRTDRPRGVPPARRPPAPSADRSLDRDATLDVFP